MRAIFALCALLFASAASADEPAYRTLAFAWGFAEAIKFNPTYAPGVSVTLSDPDDNGTRQLVVQNCGSHAAGTIELEFQAPGYLFAAFETSDSKQEAETCELSLHLYFADAPGLGEQSTASEVYILCRRGRCVSD